VSFAVDTNALLRSIDDGHSAQPIVNDGLLVLRNQGETLSIFPQNLIEFWAVATRPIANNGLGWTIDRAKSEFETLKYLFVLLPDTEAIFSEWERLVIHHRVGGKQVHDARLVAAMLVHDVTHLLTFNTSDFKRFSEITVVDPQNVI
jgi:predicted nucleic acid-binding protein